MTMTVQEISDRFEIMDQLKKAGGSKKKSLSLAIIGNSVKF
jgi:hypothetical protein